MSFRQGSLFGPNHTHNADGNVPRAPPRTLPHDVLVYDLDDDEGDHNNGGHLGSGTMVDTFGGLNLTSDSSSDLCAGDLNEHANDSVQSVRASRLRWHESSVEGPRPRPRLQYNDGSTPASPRFETSKVRPRVAM